MKRLVLVLCLLLVVNTGCLGSFFGATYTEDGRRIAPPAEVLGKNLSKSGNMVSSILGMILLGGVAVAGTKASRGRNRNG